MDNGPDNFFPEAVAKPKIFQQASSLLNGGTVSSLSKRVVFRMIGCSGEVVYSFLGILS